MDILGSCVFVERFCWSCFSLVYWMFSVVERICFWDLWGFLFGPLWFRGVFAGVCSTTVILPSHLAPPSRYNWMSRD